MFAMFFNGSPRKGWNTAKALESAAEGAREAGAETEVVNLYDFPFAGCKSCFACKLKNAKTNGICAIRDDLRPILERARQADVIVLGSPIYFSYPTGVYRAFLERLAFPVYSYHYEDGKPLVCRDKVIETANIFTMNCPEEMMKDVGYPTLLEANTQVLAAVFGASETLYVCNTYQFPDYSRYDMTLFTEEEKRAHRDAHFETDLANARALGRRLVERAM
ncbi:MAG: flavodoxin family protein [Clostridia bacterium]|nr:flavodoxin family protein [Clostridia bacterium]